jgi:hypothetical protein
LGCQWGDTIQIQFTEVSDLSDYLHPKLTTYPNPVKDELSWSLHSDKPCRLLIDVADNYGHVVYQQQQDYYQPDTQNRISFSAFPAGAYIVQVKNTTTGKTYASKTVIKP